MSNLLLQHKSIKTHRDNYGAIIPPTVNDDSSLFYSVGSLWYDINANKGYVCLDSTIGNAVWIEITAFPGGNSGNVQYNDSDIFGGDSSFTWDKVHKVLTAAGHITGNTINSTLAYYLGGVLSKRFYYNTLGNDEFRLQYYSMPSWLYADLHIADLYADSVRSSGDVDISAGGDFGVHADNVVYINDISDLPAAVGGKRTLVTNTVYKFKLGNLITLTDELVLPAGRVRIEDALISTSKQITITGGIGGGNNLIGCNITFTGENSSAFVCADLGAGNALRILRGRITATATMQLFDITSSAPSAFFILDNVATTISGKIGTITNCVSVIEDCRFLNFSDGFNFIDNIAGIIIRMVDISSGQNSVGSRMFDISGTLGQANFVSLNATPKSNEHILYFDPTLVYSGVVVSNSPFDLSESGVDTSNIFDTGSLDNTTIGFKFTGNVNIQDSTALAQIGFQDNTAQVVIDSTSVPIKVNSSSFSEDFVERFTTTVAGDMTYVGLECVIVGMHCHATMRPISGQNIELGIYVGYTKADLFEVTFTNGTNKVNRTEHGLANDTSIRFSNSGGLLPAEIRDDQFYWIINADVNDFEISDSKGGATFNFTDDGSGTSYYSLGGIINSSEGESTASSTKVESFSTQSLVEMETDDKIEIFVDNHDSTSNIVVKGIQVIINK